MGIKIFIWTMVGIGMAPYFAIFANDGAHKVMIGFVDQEQEFKLYKYGFLAPVELKK